MPASGVAGQAAAPAPDFSSASPPVYPPVSLQFVPPLVPAAPLPEKTMSVLGKIGIVLVSMLAIGYAFGAPVPSLPSAAEEAGFRIGRLLMVFLLPLLVAYIAAGRKKARNPNLFAGLFCGIGFFLLLANGATSFGANFESTDQKLRRLTREAAGLQPVRTSFFAEDKTDTKMRAFLKEIFGINKEYQQAVDKLDMSSTDKLTTPESFANPNSAAEGLRQLHAAYAVDELQEQRMQQVLENFKHRFDDLSPSDRQTMIDGFNQGLAKGMPARQRATSTEKAWIEALDDVYAYARSHHSAFSMANGRLAVANDEVLQEFNTRVRTLNARRNEFMQAKDDFEKMQGQNLQKMGLSREQTGLH